MFLQQEDIGSSDGREQMSLSMSRRSAGTLVGVEGGGEVCMPAAISMVLVRDFGGWIVCGASLEGEEGMTESIPKSMSCSVGKGGIMSEDIVTERH